MDELLSLKWNNHKSTFLHVVGSLRNKASYSDATLACNGEFYPVHRLVLSTCSEYFGDIFERTPCKSPVVVLKDIECKNLEFLLDYMYIGEVNVRQNELAALIRAAECLKIKGLAVPDEDPSLCTSNYTSKERQRSSDSSQRESSPPAKRRRSRQASNEDKNSHREDESLSRLSPSLESFDAPNSQSTNIIKAEPLDPDEENEILTNNPLDINLKIDLKEFPSDKGGGGNNSNEEDSNDLNFIKNAVAKEENNSYSNFTTNEFPGPSGLQNSNWENDSFSADSLPMLSSVPNASLDSQPQLIRQYIEQISKIAGWNKLKCPVCGKVCSRSDKLKLHLRIHTGEKPYSCTYCPHKTRTSDDLKRHVRTHTGERPYQCPFCPYKASDPSTIRSHKKHKHGFVSNKKMSKATSSADIGDQSNS